jgi:hypothetical protein
VVETHPKVLYWALANKTSCDARITDIAQPFEAHIQHLQTVVGVGRRSAEVLVSEIGVDMSRFPASAHLASWARICPGTHESAGKRRSAGTGTGNNWLRTTLLESAWAASHSRGSYLGATLSVFARDAEGFYACQRRPESARAIEDRRLRVLVRTSFTEFRQSARTRVSLVKLLMVSTFDVFIDSPWFFPATQNSPSM